jgi:(2Fe-2S) ferredoxin
MPKAFILVCCNLRQDPRQPSCAARGGREILAAIQAQAQACGSKVSVEASPCFGHCPQGAVVRVGPGGSFHHGVVPDDAAALLAEAEALAAR